jgi:cytochrome bd-type quinol oxidase subunit 1
MPATRLQIFICMMVDENQREVKFGIALPKFLTFLVHNDFKTPIRGLDSLIKRPPSDKICLSDLPPYGCYWYGTYGLSLPAFSFYGEAPTSEAIGL